MRLCPGFAGRLPGVGEKSGEVLGRGGGEPGEDVGHIGPSIVAAVLLKSFEEREEHPDPAESKIARDGEPSHLQSLAPAMGLTTALTGDIWTITIEQSGQYTSLNGLQLGTILARVRLPSGIVTSAMVPLVRRGPRPT